MNPAGRGGQMVDLAPLLLLLTAAAEVWLPVCACHPPAPHAARMDGYATTAASGLMGLIFSLSTVGKVKGLASGSGHPAVSLLADCSPCHATTRPVCWRAVPEPDLSPSPPRCQGQQSRCIVHRLDPLTCCVWPQFGEGKRYPGWFLPIAAAHEAATVAALATGKTGLALVGSCGFLGGVAYTNFNPMDGMVWAKGPKSVIPLTVAGGATAVVASSCTGAVDVSLAAGMVCAACVLACCCSCGGFCACTLYACLHDGDGERAYACRLRAV